MDEFLIPTAAIAALLGLSAFLSLAETAFTAASRPLIHQLEAKGNRRAAIVRNLHARMGRLLGAILLGNNAVNIASSTIAAGVLIAAFGDAGIAYATVGMTLLIVIFAEILPKTFAFDRASRVALAIAPIVATFVFVLGPITHGIQVVLRALFKLFRVELRAEDDAFAMTAEELRGAIELHGTGDPTVRQEREMLKSVLDLSQVEIGEIMIHRKDLNRINVAEAPGVILLQMLASPHTRVPLWRGNPDNIVGVLNTKDVLRALIERGGNVEGLDVAGLATPPWFVPDTTPLLDQLQAFRAKRQHFAIVVDEYGTLMGIVTLEDILEEIVGGIADEHDTPVAGVRQHADGSYTVAGNVTIRELNRDLDWNLPDAKAATVAGLVLFESRRIPDVGQTFLFYGYRFEILRRQRHQIALLRVTPPRNGSTVAAAAAN
ncbi:MAG: HlyC/CorC family transporter [Rhodospirillales bacterium]|nr:HlyC/CorC family transporter [Rhodospirillales bacterium]